MCIIEKIDPSASSCVYACGAPLKHKHNGADADSCNDLYESGFAECHALYTPSLDRG